VITSDSLALVALYNNIFGGAWINQTNWLSAPVSSWFGIAVSNFRVSGISMPGNRPGNFNLRQLPIEIGQLSGLESLDLSGTSLGYTLPSELGLLTKLQSLNLGNNLIVGSLPSLIALSDLTSLNIKDNKIENLSDLSGLSSLVSLDVRNNLLQFDDIGAIVSIPGVSYNPQSPVDLGNPHSLSVGLPLSISSLTGGSANSYLWKKNAISTGVTSSQYLVANVQLSDAGDYSVEVTSVLVPGLTLSSTVVNVTVSDFTTPPIITSFTPVAAAPGASIVISGNHFNPLAANNHVYFGPIEGNVSAASSTSLTVTVPPGAGFGPISVAANSLVAYSVSSFAPLFNSSGIISGSAFTPRIVVDASTGISNFILHVNDIDSDGKPDITSSLIGVPINTKAYRNVSGAVISPGSFSSPTDLGMGAAHVGSQMDLDNDGKVDVVGYVGLTGPFFFKNIATPGTINASSFSNVVATNWYHGEYVDIDGDGRLDVVANAVEQGIVISRNINPAGTVGANSFSLPVYFPFGGIDHIWGIKIKDLDGDNKPEIIGYGYQGPFSTGSISILRNTSIQGALNYQSFAPSFDFSITSSYICHALAVGDLDGDGKAELIADSGYDGASGYLILFKNTSSPGSLSFNPGGTLPYNASSPEEVFAHDLNGDGQAEVVVRHYAKLTIFKNFSASHGTCTAPFSFGPPQQMDLGPVMGASNIINSLITDLNSDNKPDIAYGGLNRVNVIQNIIPDSWPTPSITGFTPSTGVVGNTISISGSNFSTTIQDNVVRIDGVPTVVTAASASSLSFVVPSGTTIGPHSLSIEVGGQIVTSSFSIDSPVQNGLHFDGVNDRVSLPVINTGAELTLEAWVNLPDVSGTKSIVSNTNGYQLSVRDGKIFSQIFNGSVNVIEAGVILTNQWTHLAVTFKAGGNMVAYINGAAVGSVPVSVSPITASTLASLIGQSTLAIIDEVAIWSVERTSVQIQNDMLGNTPSQCSLQAYYDFNQGTAGANNSSVTSLLDRSTYNRNGTLINFALNGITSNWVSGTIQSGPSITISAQPTSISVCDGTAGIFNVGASGTTNLIYQWQKFDGSTYNNINDGGGYSGAGSATLSINTTGNFGAGDYRCKVSGDAASDVFSTPATLTVNSIPGAPASPVNGSSCGTGSVTVSVSGALNGEYRWYATPTGGVAIAAEVDATYTVPVVASTTTYYAAININSCESSTRTPVVATIHTIPAAPGPVPNSNCGPGSVSLGATGATNGQYRWYAAAVGGTAFSGEVNNTYPTPVLASTTSYFVSINDGNCESSSRTEVVATINAVPSDPAAPIVDGPFCSGSTFEFTTSGASPGEYRWYTVASGGTPIASAVNDSYSTVLTTAATPTYYVSINILGCESGRQSATALVIPLPTSPVVATPAPVCPGSSVPLVASGAVDGLYRWYDGGALITGEFNGTYTIISLTANRTLEVTINDGTCESTKTTVLASIQSCTPPVITTNVSAPFLPTVIRIDLAPLLSDPENNLDLASIQIISGLPSGATATLEGTELVIDYNGISFPGIETIVLRVCDLTGLCTDETLTINLSSEIGIYNAMSPNGDGKNEMFYIENIDKLPDTKENKVTIFNRWGSVVFETTNYDNAGNVFKGIGNNGSELPPGTYYYSIEFTSGAPKRTGFLSLRK
jgi:gliding motility-associated-like protein